MGFAGWVKRNRNWLMGLAPFFVMAGIVASIWPDYMRVRTWEYPGTDFRVVWASAKLMRQGMNPYDLTLIPPAYQAAGFPLPATFVGKGPVYPEFTFALMLPFTFLPGILAQWVWMFLTAVGFAVALRRMMLWAQDKLGFGVIAQLGTVAVCGTVPMVAFVLDVDNVAGLASVLCLSAFCVADDTPGYASALLAIGSLLKPHLALPVALAIYLVGMDALRSALRRAMLGALGFVLAVSAALALGGHLVPDTRMLSMLLRDELTSGSMSPGYLGYLALVTQITTFSHLMAMFPVSVAWQRIISFAVVAAIFGFLCVAAWHVWRQRPARGVASKTVTPAGRLRAEEMLLYVCLWNALSLLATYHRMYDGLTMLLFVPWLVYRAMQRETWKRWSFLAGWLLTLAGGLTLCLEFYDHRNPPPVTVLGRIGYYEQPPLGTLLLAVGGCLGLAVLLARQRAKKTA